MAEVLVSFVFDQSIAAVWTVLRDFNSISSWLPGARCGEIENGLPDDTSSAASADKKKEDGKGG